MIRKTENAFFFSSDITDWHSSKLLTSHREQQRHKKGIRSEEEIEAELKAFKEAKLIRKEYTSIRELVEQLGVPEGTLKHWIAWFKVPVYVKGGGARPKMLATKNT